MKRRQFVQLSVGGTLVWLGRSALASSTAAASKVISPGCRKSKLKIARLYFGVPKAHYPNPAIDVHDEVRRYQAEFAKLEKEFADVDFVVDTLVSSPEDAKALAGKIASADGVLGIHLTLHTQPIIDEILRAGRPTMIFSAPYAGHEWYALSAIRREDRGRNMECILTADMGQLAAAVRPFRALHHLRQAKVLNLAARQSKAYVESVQRKFGTEIKLVPRERVLGIYEAVSDRDAQAEAGRWTRGATVVVEPSADEILRSSRLALAFERLLDEEQATVLTVDCYGSMYHQLPAFPCVGFARLNDMGLGGVCQSDLPCVVVHVLLQGLTGRPGYVCNPTFDFMANQATLIHCLGSTKPDGPEGPSAPYKLRSIMERQEGAVPQATMRVGEAVTQAILEGTEKLRYFTGRISDTPDTERGCRTKIAVRVDGDAEKLWQNWTAGIHRVSCYGNLAKDLARFARLAKLELVNEAV